MAGDFNSDLDAPGTLTASPAAERMEVEEPTTTRKMVLNGRDVRLAIREPTAGRPPLLLMSGLGSSLEVLQPFVDALSPGAGVIRFDAPGVGFSETPSWPYRLARLSRSLEVMVDGLGYEEVDVLGISWGGLLAQHFAARNSGRCRRLVLVSTAPCTGAIPGQLLVLREMLTRRRYTDSEYALAVAPLLYGGAVRDDPALVTLLHKGHPATTRGYLYQCLAGISAAGPPFFPVIRQQTLVLAGDDDPLIPLINARVLRLMLPNARLRIFDDGHLGLLTRAPELARVVEEFLSREDTRRRGQIESALNLTRVTALGLVHLMTDRFRPPAPAGQPQEGARDETRHAGW